MANNDIAGADIAQHEGRDLASVRALFQFGRAILSSDTDIRSLKPIGNGLQRSKHGRDHNLAMSSIGYQRLQRKRGVDRFTHGLVHLPVSSDYRFTHGLRKLSLVL